MLSQKVSKAYLTDVFKKWDDISGAFILKTALMG